MVRFIRRYDMRFGIRKKMLFITLFVSILISFAIGFSIYRQAYRLFLENFIEEKLALARSISDSLDGESVTSFTTPERINDSVYRHYQRYLNDIKKDNDDISYLYAVIYDEKRGYHIYTLDGNVNKSHTLWVESTLFALICRIEDSEILVEYDQKKYTGDFQIEAEGNTIDVSLKSEKGIKGVYINGALLFSILSEKPLLLNTAAGSLSEMDNLDDLSRSGSITTNNEPVPLYLTLSLKGLPESIPGEPFNEHDPDSIELLNGLLSEDRDYITEEFEKTEFGDSLFIYSIIHDSVGKPSGVLSLEVWAREVTEYRRSILLAAGIVSVIAFILSVSIYLLVTENMVIKAIKKFSKGVSEITRGNFDFHVNIKRQDEIGDLATTFNGMADGLKERDLVKDLFGKYVQKEVAEKAMQSEIKLGGEKQVGTVLFSDIRSFTTISEQLEPQDLVSMLNRYFTTMVDRIINYNGVLDKYIGDALMVHFGILGEAENSADNAVQAAIEMIKSLHDFNNEQKRLQRPKISIGVGIHTGGLVAGNIGSPNRLEYTVIGDTVNLASRAEGLTKLFGAHIVITEATHAGLKPPKRYLIRPLDLIVVKGKTNPVQMYEVYDGDGEADRRVKQETAGKLLHAVTLYRNRAFDEAKRELTRLIELNQDDKLVSYYLELCNYFRKNPPGKDWDGSAVMRAK
jgi:class 3 adenylate cyclase